MVWLPLTVGMLLAGARPTATLQVQRGPGAEGCPSQEGFAELVTARLGYAPFSPDATIHARVEFSADARGRRVLLSLRSPGAEPSERELVDASTRCEPLAAAAALALSVAIDPEVLSPRPRQPLAPAPPAPPKVEQRPAPPPAPPMPLRWQLGVGAAVDVGAAPTVNGALVLHGGLQAGRAELGLELRVDLPSRWSAGAGDVSSQVIAGSVLPCFAFKALRGCGVLTVGALRAESRGLVGSTQLSAPLALAGLRLAAVLEPRPWLLVTPWVDVLAAITRVSLIVDGAPIWTTPALSGLAGVRVSVPWL